MAKFVDSPLDILVGVYNREYGKPVDIFIIDRETVESYEKGAKGVTFFDEDDKAVEIVISADQTLMQILDVIAHELAHTIAGFEAGHNEEFKKVYQNLNRLYTKEIERLDREYAD